MIDVRTVTADELPAILTLVEGAFGTDLDPEDLPIFTALTEPDRTYAGSDGGDLAGAGSVLTVAMTVPGGPLPAAGVTAVGVSPVHRRRGVLNAVMGRMLGDAVERGTEPFATLLASEPANYTPNLKGTASRRWLTTIEAHDPVLLGRPPEGRVRLVDEAEMRTLAARVYDAARPERPGFLSRHRPRWDWRFHEPVSRRAGASSLRFAVYEEAGEPRGYAWYKTKPSWTDVSPNGTVVVKELVALDAAASGGLWRYLFGIDLMRAVAYDNVAADDPVFLRLRDPRLAKYSIADGLWVRVLDVPAAFGGRAYLGSGRVTFEVVDDRGGWAAGRWTLDASPEGATCAPAGGASADLTLGVEELGAVYLGDTRLRALHEAGRVDEHTPGAVRAASLLLAWDRAAWCPEIF